MEITGYVDADFADDTIDRKSYTSFVFMLGNGGISWLSKKQSNVAISSSVTEYVAASEACRKVKFLKNFSHEIINQNLCIKLFNDNQTTLT